MACCVLGATGFIGGQIARAAVARGWHARGAPPARRDRCDRRPARRLGTGRPVRPRVASRGDARLRGGLSRCGSLPTGQPQPRTRGGRGARR
jgi:uncharacterized protein YbjT (DUF2867 family)